MFHGNGFALDGLMLNRVILGREPACRPGFLPHIYTRSEYKLVVASWGSGARNMGVELAYTDAVARATEGLYAKVASVIPPVEWPVHAPLIDAINRLKRE